MHNLVFLSVRCTLGVLLHFRRVLDVVPFLSIFFTPCTCNCLHCSDHVPRSAVAMLEALVEGRESSEIVLIEGKACNDRFNLLIISSQTR